MLMDESEAVTLTELSRLRVLHIKSQEKRASSSGLRVVPACELQTEYDDAFIYLIWISKSPLLNSEWTTNYRTFTTNK